jgi:hypothetical protein
MAECIVRLSISYGLCVIYAVELRELTLDFSPAYVHRCMVEDFFFCQIGLATRQDAHLLCIKVCQSTSPVFVMRALYSVYISNF